MNIILVDKQFNEVSVESKATYELPMNSLRMESFLIDVFNTILYSGEATSLQIKHEDGKYEELFRIRSQA